jgi:hypothetical protein
MKYISLAFYKSELIVVQDMDVFTAHFCYSKKQRQGSVDIPVPAVIASEDDEDTPDVTPVIEDIEAVDDDIL